MTIYRLSLRGRRGSRFARRYNATMRFATRHAAETHPAHRGDGSRIVPVTVSVEELRSRAAIRNGATCARCRT